MIGTRTSRPQWRWLLATMLALALLVPGVAISSAADVPFLTGRVVDNAEIISPPVREGLERTLKDYESATTHQIVVLTIPTLGGESIEDFSQRVFDDWKLGSKGKDNGVLVVVAPQERRMRIHVGYGLEGALTDVAASRIIRNVMTPRFKENKYDQGIKEGIDAVIAQIEGRPEAAAASSSAPGVQRSRVGPLEIEEPDIGWPMRILLGAFIFGIIGVFTVLGVMTPGMGWLLYVFLIPFWAIFPIVIVGPKGALALLATYVVAFPIAKIWVSHRPWYEKAAHDLRTTGHASVGGMILSSGGGSSGGDSGGGFSGGGGSSGGGGASGSW
jgi:uncharacterized protein